MGWGVIDRVRDWLRGGDPPPPDEMVELLVVPLHQGPMTVDALRRAGIKAEGHEAFDVVTGTLARFVVRVPRADIAKAELALERLR